MSEIEAQSDSAEPQRLFTFRSGGWVILITALGSLALIIWAVAPALMQSFTRPPGDGTQIETYRFDLTNCLVEKSLIVPAMLHRDMVPFMSNPNMMAGSDVARLNAEERGKFLVSSDRVIGVEIGGESRAYPISILNVHEIINDTLGGIPIVVTYHWTCDSVRVFQREVEGSTVEFGVSGLLYNSNLLMYIRGDADPESEDHQPESLWCQLQARAITGDHAADGQTLNVIRATLTNWAQWLTRHPDTTVITRDPAFAKRYKGAEPTSYFLSDNLIAPVHPMPDTDAIGLKDKVIAIRGETINRVYPLRVIARNLDDEGVWLDPFPSGSVRFEAYDDAGKTVLVTVESESPPEVIHGFWFALHGMFPELELVQ